MEATAVQAHTKECPLFSMNESNFTSNNATKRSLTDWHATLGHNNCADVQKLRKLVDGMVITDDEKKPCNVCLSEKAKNSPIPKLVGTRAQAPLDIVHADICGPVDESVDGYKYIIGFVDSYSRLLTMYPIKSNIDVMQATAL